MLHNRYLRYFLSLAFSLAVLAFLIRYQLTAGFELIPGDRYDGVISTVILEHWYRFFSGQTSWLDVGYFYPYSRTIAQTDAYFLIGLFYSPFRFFGIDPFISSELANLVVKFIGFWSFYLLAKRAFGLSFYWALLGATVFTISNGMTVHSNRIQLATVAFAPLLSFLMWRSFTAFAKFDTSMFRRYGVLSGLLFGLWCLTCFYMAWFFFYFVVVFIVLVLILDRFTFVRKNFSYIRSEKFSICFVFIIAILSISPFLYAFLPKSIEVGVRSYEAVLKYTVLPEEILQVGHQNLMLGRIYNDFLTLVSPGYSPAGEYYNTGIALFVFIFFVCSCFQIINKNRDSKFLTGLVLATVLTWASVISISGHSVWFLVYSVFPGAKALNAVSTYQIFIAFPVVLLAIRYLSLLRLKRVMAVFIGFVLVLSEVNKPHMALDRQAELDRVLLPTAAPSECVVFYVSGWAEQDSLTSHPVWVNNYYAHNVSAMFISQLQNLPTINGVASFNPPDWNFGFPNQSDYDSRVMEYAANHGIQNLCKLDLNTKRWVKVN